MSALYGTPPHSATSNGFNLSSPSPFKVDDDDDIAFDSPKEEASYYRDKYRVAVDLLNETRAELDEFQLSSRELEQELEKELEATEAKHADLQERIQRLETDKDEWKNKFIALQKQHSSTVSTMQLEMDNLRSERDKTLVAIRDLEMGNDELESMHRVTHSSLLDMEIKYNRSIEEKTLLEQEVIAKQELDEECQRLKDDVRDANNEIAILRDRLARAVVPTPPSSDAPMSPMMDMYTRSDAPSPTLTDGSAATHRSSPSATATGRTDRSPTVTPRTVRQSPRIPRSTTTPVLASPNVRRTLPAPSPSGIPALTRSTTTRNLAPNEAAPMRRTFTTANLSGQTTKTKGLRLLQDIQTRLKATDDRLGARMPKRSVIPPRKSTLPSSTTVSTVPATNAQHTRVAALSKPPPGANVTPTGGNASVLSPSWVMLSDPEDTPPAHPGPHRKHDPSSPLEPTRGVGANMLPKRPGIPSPLAPQLGRSHRGSPGHTPAASARTLHKSHRASGRQQLSLSTGLNGPLAGRSSLSQSVRAGVPLMSSQTQAHTRSSSRSGAISPSFIPEPSRRASIGSQILSPTDSLVSFGQSISGRSSRADHSRNVSADLRALSRSSMRPPSSLDIRPASRSDMRPASRSDMRPSSRTEMRIVSRSDMMRPRSRIGSVDERGERVVSRGTQSTGPRPLGRGPAPGMGGLQMAQSASTTSVASGVSAASGISAASAQSSLSAASTRSNTSNVSIGTRGAHASMPAPGTKAMRRPPRRSSVGVNDAGARPSSIPGPKTPVGARPTSVPFMDTPPPPMPRIPSHHLRRG
ncbi:uncharacterized protein CcaverHIS019_0702490 [Cutaneotrichosporon cavernicola]|uniref:NUDE domain-containing protein n=1 Tax=Cutaneotrichosporon cavernicola TaxID=279322 RepID=A0AA48QYT0_9TREE|nr:uncharacterized protein CcaverHIS019_0702490 [Cutaneotrichosporon cavernicola]BEI94668.1 hypothetical protein CcaverHIS019_0702490 [Cutaneotrichosporon cavernicola]BEJ02443.1 hypothetical protein CcaverHIS631_0702380 [Cutaneotrichosporon cavernicola]BEJ10202.1 hypothetical protein CcaverHIS641_0702370 [Cutaneotrichosporon cavernicola]